MRGPEHLLRCMQCGESWIDHTRSEIRTCSGFQPWPESDFVRCAECQAVTDAGKPTRCWKCPGGKP